MITSPEVSAHCMILGPGTAGTSPVFDQLETITNWTTKTPEPDLAVNWTESNGGKTVVINLRQGVYWQDGSPLNATDVAFTWNLIMNPKAGTDDYYGVRPILSEANWTITGPYQITLNFSQPDPFWQYLLYSRPEYCTLECSEERAHRPAIKDSFCDGSRNLPSCGA